MGSVSERMGRKEPVTKLRMARILDLHSVGGRGVLVEVKGLGWEGKGGGGVRGYEGVEDSPREVRSIFTPK